MTNLADQLRHSINFHLSNEELMKKVKQEISCEQERKKKERSGKPIISWEKFLKTKMVNKK